MADDPLSDGYALDIVPSAPEAAVLRQARRDDRILTARSGKGYVWERGSGSLRSRPVTALIRKHWITPPCPDGPLFGQPTDGTLTLRGSYALRRYETAR
jgi:hypothetical protein